MLELLVDMHQNFILHVLEVLLAGIVVRQLQFYVVDAVFVAVRAGMQLGFQVADAFEYPRQTACNDGRSSNYAYSDNCEDVDEFHWLLLFTDFGVGVASYY